MLRKIANFLLNRVFINLPGQMPTTIVFIFYFFVFFLFVCLFFAQARSSLEEGLGSWRQELTLLRTFCCRVIKCAFRLTAVRTGDFQTEKDRYRIISLTCGI